MKQICLLSCLIVLLFVGSTVSAHAYDDELVVQFAHGTSPQDLQKLVFERKDTEKSAIGKIKLTIEDMTLQMLHKTTPEEKLKRLEQIDKQVGLVTRERLFPEASSEDVYLIKLNGDWSVEQAEMMYSSIPEVVFAEVNSYYRASL